MDRFCAQMRVLPDPDETMYEKLARAKAALGDGAQRLFAQYLEKLCKNCKLREVYVDETSLAAALAGEIVGFMARGFEVGGDATGPVLKRPDGDDAEVPLYVNAQ